MTEDLPSFADLGLVPPLLSALARLEHVAPTAIQVRAIPPLLAGHDVLAEAQTGTGKTAAFALPILQHLDLSVPAVQAIILEPTRELAVQVAEAIHDYGRDLGPVGVLAIYGGAPIENQLRRLYGKVRVVVGTPGRVLDHLRRGSLKLDEVTVAVLDEADEMLRMGFAEDVESILAQMPSERQTILLSATLPEAITSIASRHLRDPERISVPTETRTVANIDQKYIVVQPKHRLEALARVLKVMEFGAALVFARTRQGCAELAELLEAHGLPSEAMHGDLAQSARQSVLRRLKTGQLRILVATDVAARGLDVEQIDLVVNTELPHDVTTYVHRIGRTGRAGRKGRALLFVSPRDERRFRQLERFTGQRMTELAVPRLADLRAAQAGRFAKKVAAIREGEDLAPYRALVAELQKDASLEDVAAALCRLAWGDPPIETTEEADIEPPPPAARRKVERPPRPSTSTDVMVLSLAVGRRNGVEPRDIVGAIANEGGVPGSAVGAIVIHDKFTLVEVPRDLVDQIEERMRRTTLCGRYVNIRRKTKAPKQKSSAA